MMLVRRNNNANGMTNWFDDFFFGGWLPRFDSTTPAVNVRETEEEYEMEVAAPGLKKDDCQVLINEDGNLVLRLTSGTTHSEENKNEHYLRREFRSSNFTQSYLLPKDVDKDAIAATVEDGILRITLPKRGEEATKNERVIAIQ